MKQKEKRGLQSNFYELKENVFKATSLMFLFQLLGAICGGLVDAIAEATAGSAPALVGSLYHISYWATEFFFVGFVVILTYKICGTIGIAPAFILSIYFSNFAGLYLGNVQARGTFGPFIPFGNTGGINMGYMGYLLLAVTLGLVIKFLLGQFKRFANFIVPYLNLAFKATIHKFKPLQEVDGSMPVEGIAFLMHVLFIPVVSTITVFLFILYCFALPLNTLATYLGGFLPGLFEKSNALGGLLMGLMVGADTTGPMSASAYKFATDAAVGGSSAPMTIYGGCFVLIGWVVFVGFILAKVLKKGGKFDGDDMNYGITGPINAMFMNMRLAVGTGFTMAFRRPLATIVSTIIASVFAGGLAGLVGVQNGAYLAEEYTSAFLAGDMYSSFKQPHMVASQTDKGWIFLLILGAASILGGFIFIGICHLGYTRRVKKGLPEMQEYDIVGELGEKYGAIDEDRIHMLPEKKNKKEKAKKK